MASLPDLNKIFENAWPRAYLIPESNGQWHCSNCKGIFKQYREPVISYCPWCGRKFVKVDPELLTNKTLVVPKDRHELSPKDICHVKHGVGRCEDCKKCKDCPDAQ